MQGVDGWDVDLPTVLEANYITNVFAKVVWVFCYIAVYGIRPLIVRPKPMGELLSCVLMRFIYCPGIITE